jgi:hypothetical protein
MANVTAQELGDKFFEYAKPVDGVTDWVTFEELEKHFGISFHTTNGSWAQENRGPLNGYLIEKRKVGNKLIAIKLNGLNETSNNSIRTDIRRSIKKQRCRIVDAGAQIECDHKDGRKPIETYGDILNQTEDDFQPLHKTCNDTKRHWCSECKKTNLRYDATRLGYSAGWIDGNINYEGTCFGCFWYDPRKFNQVISKDFKP